jgi:hypothetical protein
VKRFALITIAVAAASAAIAFAQSGTTDKAAAGKKAFLDVARVLQSPRCANCHPADDRPRQGDQGKPHAQNISRKSVEAGVACTTCHQDRNSEETIGLAGGPPGAPHWGLPPANQVFMGITPSQLCANLKDPAKTGDRDLAKLLDHVTNDALVKWGWNPGGKRTLPPLSHDKFVAAFKTWVDSGGACP